MALAMLSCSAKRVAYAAVVLFRPDVEAGARIDELCNHPQLFAPHEYTAFEHRVHVERIGDGAHVQFSMAQGKG